MKMGVVFEIRNGKAVVMQNDGEFITVFAKDNWQEGDIVPIRKEASWRKMAGCIAACFLALFLCSGAGVYWNQTALISFDINPSFEIGVNRFDRVIRVNALNEEGREVLSSLSIENKKYDAALEELLASEEMQAYFIEDQNLTFSIAAESEKKGQAMEAGLEKMMDSAVWPHHENIQVECYLVDQQTLQKAHAYDVTAGKYVLLLQLQEADPRIDIQEYTHHSITQIKEQTDYCKAAHKAQEEEDIKTELEPNCEKKGHHGHCGYH